MRSSIALIDFRRLSLSSPSTYRRNAPRCATWAERGLERLKATEPNRSNHAGALSGSSTARQRTKMSRTVQCHQIRSLRIRSGNVRSDKVVLAAITRWTRSA